MACACNVDTPQVTDGSAGPEAGTPQASETPVAHHDESAVAKAEEEIHIVAYAFYHCLLFIMHWGGSARFSNVKHPDDDFDPENVSHYLKNKKGHPGDDHFFDGNFRQVDPTKLKQWEAKKKAKAEARAQAEVAAADGEQGGSELGAVAPPVHPQEEPEEPRCRSPRRTIRKSIAESVAEAIRISRRVVVAVELEEEEIYENLFVKHIPPKFVIYQCLAVFILWIAGALVSKGSGSFTSRKGGLDMLSPKLYGMTDLRWSNNDCLDLRGEVWRWLSYQFSHVGITHVGMNVILNLVMGIPLEGAMGWWRLCLMYNTGVLGGALWFFALDGHGAVVGCSGGCYALIGIHLADLLMNWDSKKFKKQTVAFLIIMCIVDFTVIMVSHPEGTSHSAHIGGAVMGLVIGVLLCKNKVVEIYERVIEVEVAVAGAGLLIAAFVWIGIHDQGPTNIFQKEPGYCSAFAYKAIPAGSDIPFLHCSYCGTPECLEALRFEYQDCCPMHLNDCVSETDWCIQPTAVTLDFCKKNSARWVDLSAPP